jgi:hypothetical protein
MDQPKKVWPLVELRDLSVLGGALQDELYAVVTNPKFDNMSLSQTVGVLEFLKWNLINGA